MDLDPQHMARQSRAARSWVQDSGKKPLYLTNLPTTLIKLGHLENKEKSQGRHHHPQEWQFNPEEGCGLSCLVIPWCQRFNNIRCFMVFFCILLVSQGIVFGLTDLSIANLQKDYKLKTTENFFLTFGYDISSGLVAIFIAYYGGGQRRMRWIALSSFLVGFGSLLFAFPYFNSGHIQQEVEIEDICQELKVISGCRRSMSSFKTKYVFYFLLGQMVQGIAGMPLYILGVTFLEDSLATHSVGIYLGIADAASVFGYALGYVIGAPQVKVLQNRSTSEIIDVSNQWTQSWWIDFIFVTLIAWSTLIPLSCFPPTLTAPTNIKAGKHKQPQLLDRKYKDPEAGLNIKDLSVSIWILIKNPIFMCLTLCKASESLVLIGAAEFLPTYLEHQFVLTSSFATVISGLVLIPGGALGQFLGGYIVSTLEMSSRALMMFIIVTSTVTIILLVSIIFIHCDQAQMAGISENYYGTGQLGILTAPCNEQCKCSSSFYSPICGRDDIEYFSPCFAGCTHGKVLDKKKTYYNCSCIKEGLISADKEGDFIDASLGKCDTKCYTLPLFIAFMSSIIIFSGFSGVPLTMAVIRTLPDKLRTLALGISFVIVRIFGTIPGPLAFQKSEGFSCTFRDTNTCGDTGHCWIYNVTKMAYQLMGICLRLFGR
ncbi:solute carrier organic anion transporter family member 6A1 [Nycticebus coucang]|uniref:solute carrier organic anion transporter family member 6A1 n=1 Tax=Nycticebus coucang TaxID=9470 RepID=UPI00234D4088|nr:solute carrier organic anion transporter family member 6A1 [Nycticebus coucang]